MSKYVFLIATVLLTVAYAKAETDYLPKPLKKDPWVADSLFVGADIIVADSNARVKITIPGDRNWALKGELFFMDPNADTSIFLTDNKITDTITIELGKYATSTPLVFKFVVTDTSESGARYRGKKLFTGQNREGIDKYVSERSLEHDSYETYGARWAAVGAIDSNTVEVGFEDRVGYSFRAIVFQVSNARIKK